MDKATLHQFLLDALRAFVNDHDGYMDEYRKRFDVMPSPLTLFVWVPKSINHAVIVRHLCDRLVDRGHSPKDLPDAWLSATRSGYAKNRHGILFTKIHEEYDPMAGANSPTPNTKE